MLQYKLTPEQFVQFRVDLNNKLKGTKQEVIENYSSGKFTLEGHHVKLLCDYNRVDTLTITVQEHPFWIPPQHIKEIVNTIIKPLIPVQEEKEVEEPLSIAQFQNAAPAGVKAATDGDENTDKEGTENS